MDKKIIFVHGYTASSSVNWYPNISKELDTLGVDYSIRDFPGDRHPKQEEWLEIIEEEIGATNKLIVLVGHSLGTRAILLYLEKSQRKVDTVILIAAPTERVNSRETLGNFFEHKIDLAKLQGLADKFIVVHSKDDSDVPYEEGVEIAQGLNAKLITLEGRDHMSAPDNAPYILEILKTVL